MEITSWGLTDTGCVRSNNEDAFLIREDLCLYVVADGVGGAAAGEVASDLFVQNCAAEFENIQQKWHKDYSAIITKSFKNGNRLLREHMEENPETKGMGCTAELITFHGVKYYIGHVGDSRTYLIRDQGIQQLTKDHSYVQEQIDLGLLEPEDAETHWMKNTIYRAVGGADELDVDIFEGMVKDGDLFLMCSDGLTDMVNDDDILEIVLSADGPQGCAEKLVEAAKGNGGNDNVTVLLCQVAMTTVVERITAYLFDRIAGPVNRFR